MKKQVGMTVLAASLLFAGAADASATTNGKTASKFESLADGRQTNGIGTGVIEGLAFSGTDLVEGETLTISVDGVVIDGPLDTLKWSITDQSGQAYDFGDHVLAAGTYTFTVQASTYFKNGQKAGLVHSTTAPQTVSVTVVEKPEAVAVSVVSAEVVAYNYTVAKTNAHGVILGYHLEATVAFKLSNGETLYDTRHFNNVQPSQSLGFSVAYGEETFVTSIAPPAYPNSN